MFTNCEERQCTGGHRRKLNRSRKQRVCLRRKNLRKSCFARQTFRNLTLRRSRSPSDPTTREVELRKSRRKGNGRRKRNKMCRLCCDDGNPCSRPRKEKRFPRTRIQENARRSRPLPNPGSGPRPQLEPTTLVERELEPTTLQKPRSGRQAPLSLRSLAERREPTSVGVERELEPTTLQKPERELEPTTLVERELEPTTLQKPRSGRQAPLVESKEVAVPRPTRQPSQTHGTRYKCGIAHGHPRPLPRSSRIGTLAGWYKIRRPRTQTIPQTTPAPPPPRRPTPKSVQTLSSTPQPLQTLSSTRPLKRGRWAVARVDP
jgi:hypothetical protein